MDRKPSRWPLVTIILISLLLLYLGGFGPACWISSRYAAGDRLVNAVYQPVMRLHPRPLRRMTFWYAQLWAAPIWGFIQNSETYECRWVCLSWSVTPDWGAIAP